MMKRETYIVTFAATPGWSVPPAARLKRLLKFAGRQLGLRCTSIEPAPPPPACPSCPRSSVVHLSGPVHRCTRCRRVLRGDPAC